MAYEITRRFLQNKNRKKLPPKKKAREQRLTLESPNPLAKFSIESGMAS